MKAVMFRVRNQLASKLGSRPAIPKVGRAAWGNDGVMGIKTKQQIVPISVTRELICQEGS